MFVYFHRGIIHCGEVAVRYSDIAECVCGDGNQTRLYNMVCVGSSWIPENPGKSAAARASNQAEKEAFSPLKKVFGALCCLPCRAFHTGAVVERGIAGWKLKRRDAASVK